MNSFKSLLTTTTLIMAIATFGCGAESVDIGNEQNEIDNGQKVAAGSINGDYGDAPDQLETYPSNITAKFPTRLSSDGARHSDTTIVALGMEDDQGNWPNSAEDDATDPNDPDGVQNIDEPTGTYDNDAYDDGLLTFVYPADTQTSLEFAVTTDATSVQDTYYLNVLFDWNRDGEWRGQDSNGADEWAVKNFAVTIGSDEARVFRTDLFDTGMETTDIWMRMTLSEKPIDAAAFPEGWDGTGEYALGETEDYYLNHVQVLPLVKDAIVLDGVPVGPFHPQPLPPPPGGGGGPFPPFGGGAGGGNGGGGGNACEYDYSLRITLCKGKSLHRLLTIGGFAPDSLSASSDNPSVASVSLNEANVTINANEEGETTIHITAKQGQCTYYLTIYVKVKKCEKKKPARIDCCSPEEIRRDPSLCRNCRIVGRQWNQTNTHGGGGTIPETSMEGRKTNISKSFVLIRGGGLADILTVYYECDPCPEDNTAIDGQGSANDWLASLMKVFIDGNDHTDFGGENGIVDDYYEFEDMVNHYDEEFDESVYECSTRYFQEMSTVDSDLEGSDDSGDELEATEPGDTAWCFSDNECQDLISSVKVTRDTCKGAGGHSWGGLIGNCEAI